MQKIISIPEIGDIIIQKNKRSRRMTLRIHPLRGIYVTIPYRTSFEDAEHFVRSKKDWIQIHLPKVSFQSNLLIDMQTVFRTRTRTLKIQSSPDSKLQCVLTPDTIQIQVPTPIPIHHSSVQHFIRNALLVVLKKEAKIYLPKRVEELAKQKGFSYSKVAVRNNKTRWGSCSHDNQISLNIQLIRLPDELIDYVILHELCHTIEKNHQKPFWDLMDKVTHHQAKKWDKELKKFLPYF